MKINIIGISASPRVNSNSKYLLESSIAHLKQHANEDLEYEIIDLKEKKINPCRACAVCGKDKTSGDFIPCAQNGTDDVQDIFEKMIHADGVIVASPVYFGVLADIFHRFINRTRLLRHQNFRLANKPVGIMAVAGRRSGGGEIAIMSAWNPFIRNGCLLVGNGGGTSQYGAIAWAGAPGSIAQDHWGMLQGRQVAERVYSVARLIKAGGLAEGYAFPMKFSYSEGMPQN